MVAALSGLKKEHKILERVWHIFSIRGKRDSLTETDREEVILL